MSEIDPGESKASDTALGVEVDTVLSEAARLAASEKRDIPVRDASGQIVGMLRIPDMLAVLAGRGQHAKD
jgi:CBS-domain-containing membrane protein